MQTLGHIDINTLNNTVLSNKIISKNDNKVKIWNLSKDSFKETGLLVDQFRYYYTGDTNDSNAFDNYGELNYLNNPLIKSYSGTFINGNKNGQGNEEYVNGDIFVGFFIDNKKNGPGKLYSKNGILKFEGTWLYDKINGSTIGYDYNEQNNKIYFGCMEDGIPHGVGIKIKNNMIYQIGVYNKNIPEATLEIYTHKIQDLPPGLKFKNKSDDSTFLPIKIKLFDPSLIELNKFLQICSNIVEPYDIEDIKKLVPYMITNNTTNIDMYDDSWNKYYSGKCTINIENQEYIFNGIGKFSITSKSAMNGTENFIFDGNFSNNNFISGSVIKNGKLFCNGTYKNLNILNLIKQSSPSDNISINSNDLIKLLSDCEYISLSNRQLINGSFRKLIFKGKLNNGSFNKGSIYIVVNEPNVDNYDLTHIYSNLKLYYDGSFENDPTLPFGSFKFKNYGTEYWFSTGTPKYQGNWKNSKYSGSGVLFHELNESIEYVGNFTNNNKQGKGSLFDPEGNLIYEGMFNNNQISS